MDNQFRERIKCHFSYGDPVQRSFPVPSHLTITETGSTHSELAISNALWAIFQQAYLDVISYRGTSLYIQARHLGSNPVRTSKSYDAVEVCLLYPPCFHRSPTLCRKTRHCGIATAFYLDINSTISTQHRTRDVICSRRRRKGFLPLLKNPSLPT